MTKRPIAIVVLTASLAACSVIPRTNAPATEEPAFGTPSETTASTPSASATLLAQSRDARTTGDYVAATAAIERALRIEPNGAALWLEYARLRMAEGDFQQAETLARKSVSLAGEDDATRNAAGQLIAEAREAQTR